MKNLFIETVATFILAVTTALILGITIELAFKASILFTTIWMARYIPYNHPYGYKGDWYGYKKEMIP